MGLNQIISWAAPLLVSALVGAGATYATVGSQASTIVQQEARIRALEITSASVNASVDERLKNIEASLERIEATLQPRPR